MLFFLPTKKGLGFELWGNYDDIYSLYKVICNFYNDENKPLDLGFETRLDQSLILQLEYWIEKAMFQYDPKGATELSKFIKGRIDIDNIHLYQYMRNIDNQYVGMPRGKKSFRKIPTLLKKACYGTIEYWEYNKQLELSASHFGCDVSTLDINPELDNEYSNW